MSRERINAVQSLSILFFVFVLWRFPLRVHSQDMNGYSQTGNSALIPLVDSQLGDSSISNLRDTFRKYIVSNLGFCIKDVDADWNGAFNFTSNMGFISSCIDKTKDLDQRLCTAAEIKFYFSSIVKNQSQGSESQDSESQGSKYLRFNKNCNLTMWNPGCEPGWACSVRLDEKVDLNSTNIPTRTRDCQACCEGFFCPHGITCMIPCPLGAHCPLAKLNETTGVCDPYFYQLPPGQQNHTCGGADIWADVKSSSEVFCPAGSYCPTTTQKIPCSNGHYCRRGSTSEKKCFKLSTCNPNTANQKIHAYGGMLIAALVTLLLLIYNCSDQVLTTRERRQAKSREAAARSARETAQARGRWKSARNVAKKHVLGLQAQLSRTFSRKRSAKQIEEMNILGQANTVPDDAFLPQMPPSTSSASQQSSAGSGTKEPSNVTKMMQELEDHESNEGLNIGDNKNYKKHKPKGKQMNSQTQIFKYAYGKLEKEKALQEENKNLTFCGVISMATNPETRTRPAIEVAFKDLTLTLKGKHKQLLRCVTGKIVPGRVSAVMGPSGAGKTTFLNALAGKATGCEVTGSVFINGKLDSVHSYKKIIGFVPQDDIVHGNLTVEENLQFSAKCRLSADMPKADKVLVVERVIYSLALQAVRDSIVGTVEKRGISGGQRKRVNVGLEMVMEPSLLILDEPTSGLDSSSSQLLLKALCREALEGVNICMVVHQPSYTLFRMFDDLILLAKGGLVAYLGPVKDVEEYFSTLGINVPDRVNPPDYFIDILEGVAKPDNDIDIKQLPIRWMLHKGYQVPPDMQHYAAGIASSSNDPNTSNETNPLNTGDDKQSFAGDLWQDVRTKAEIHRDHIHHNFLKSKDLSNRKTPGIYRQYRYYLGRIVKQRLREARTQAVDFLILLLAGACLGTLSKVSDSNFGADGYIQTIIGVSLLCKIAALRSFSLDKLIYWRESSSGMSSLAYFLAKDTVDHFNTLVKPVVYLSMFYFFNNPRSSFADNYIVLVCLVYCVTGIAYAFAILLEPGPAQLWSVLLPVVLTLIATQERTGSLLKIASNLCYPKWALEAFVIANVKRYSGVWLITRCGALMKSGYDIRDWGLCISILILYGVVSRTVAFLCMITFKKK